ncbi:MAG TPA: glycosyltransferase, partial [Gammaproteobacteria bacterium]|nr:glycosyltransferase [Gammaproteobacteria bacterium]
MNPYTCPAVSAIVVNYNAGAFLGLCIERIRKSIPAVELIVVDNHSRDISKIWALGCNGRQNEKY